MNNPSSPDPLENIDAVKAEARIGPPSQAGASITAEAYAISHADLGKGIGKYRWRICALLFMATSIFSNAFPKIRMADCISFGGYAGSCLRRWPDPGFGL